MKKEKDGVYEQIKSITKPIFDEVLQADVSNSMTTPKKPISILWRPNNYRRQIEAKEKTNSTIKKINTTIPKANVNPHTKIVSIKNYAPNITIQYGKNTVTAIYSQNKIGGHKETFKISTYSINDLEERINQKKQEIEEKINNTLNMFLRQFKLSLPLRKPIWARYEDWIKGIDWIDKIPKETIIHDTYFKKVYGDGIELIKAKDEEPTAHLKNIVKNNAITELAPEIANSINALNDVITPAIKNLALNMNTHVSIMKKIEKGIGNFNKTVKKLNNRLDQKRLNEWL